MFHCAFTAESEGERISKIDQHLAKLWTIKYRFVFFIKHDVVNVHILKEPEEELQETFHETWDVQWAADSSSAASVDSSRQDSESAD